jgi:hypothetical protein
MNSLENKNNEIISTQEMVRITSSLQSEGRFRTAMDNIIRWLEIDTAQRETILDLAAIIMSSGMSRSSETYNATEPLTEEYIIDRRFDSIFCECNQCQTSWVLHPAIKHSGGGFFSNPPGAKCPQCNNVYCRACSADGEYLYHCPKCHVKLEIMKEATGRSPRQTARRKNIERVFFFREGSIPPSPEYIAKWTRRLSPDVIEQNLQPEIIYLPNWQKDEESLLREAGKITIQKMGKMPVAGSIELENYFAKDENNNYVYILKQFPSLQQNASNTVNEKASNQTPHVQKVNLLDFIKRFFNKNKNKATEKNKVYNETDNLGARHDTMKAAEAYWTVRLQMPKKEPFVGYTFESAESARSALLELPCIHLAQDSGKLICTEVLIFGYYPVENEKYRTILCGDELTVELWQLSKQICEKYGGELNNELKPIKHTSSTQAVQPILLNKVKFIKEHKELTSIYRIYQAPNAATAKEYLRRNPVDKKLYYLIVETPDGNYCRDIEGTFKEP